ncbi:MAG: hypothetical protein EP319_05910 [Deltaproteobacteria bacterium]|nr:MAG: hypothetical protein EP319_05910 [Deltaproteobacteria bacterium]
MGKYFKAFIALVLVTPMTAWSLPIDWHGAFGVDSTLIDNYRRLESVVDNSSPTTGSQEVELAAGKHANASWQSYVFRLNPVLIVNDAASLKGEISSGYGRGGYLGDDNKKSNVSNPGASLYYYNQSTGTNDLVLNKFYMELYSDTATYQIGRHSYHWGLGALYNSGDKLWDRHSFTRDGITMNIKLGSFHIRPYWGKISQGSGTTASFTRATNSKEYGFSLLYDNPERDMSFGLLYGKKLANAFNNDDTGPGATANTLGQTDVKITDIYFSKTFGIFDFGIEVPLMGGEIGNVYTGTSQVKYKAKAFLLESNLKVTDSWKFGLDAGQVSGDAGTQSSFDAMYLNPNYQIANLLFRYNLRAVSRADGNRGNIYDSYITNATYFKARAEYVGEKWSWNAAVIKAVANETADLGQTFYVHETNTYVSTGANTTQSDDMGIEIDLGFNYKWNDEINIGGNFGYLMAGDYYSFTNSTGVINSADNSMVLQINTGITF